MNVVKKIGLTGIADFKKSVLEIKTGVQYLYGKNMLLGGIGNAAGKSVLGSSVADIFYDTPIVGTKQDKPKTGVRFIEFTRSGKLVRIQQAYKGHSEQISITVDGQEKKGRTKRLTKAMLPKLWPISEDEYRTYGHLDSNVPHPLVMGSSIERKAFFTSFFQLDRLDNEKKVLSSYALELKKVRARFTELDTTFKAVKSDMLTREQRVEMEIELKQLEHNLDRLRQKADKAQHIKSLVDFENYSSSQLQELNRICPDIGDLTEDFLKLLKTRRRKAVALEEKLSAWKAYYQALQKYEEQISELDMSLELEELESRSVKFVKATAELKILNTYVDPRLMYPGLEQNRVEKPEVPKEELAKMQVRLDHMKDHASKFSKGICGECGQQVKKIDHEKIEQLEIRVRRLENKWSKYDKWLALKTKFDASLEDYELKAKQRNKTQSTQNKYRDDHVLYMKRRKIEKPESVEKPEEAEDVTTLIRSIGLAEWALQHKETIEACRQLTDHQRSTQFTDSRLEYTQDRASKLKTKLSVHQTVKNRASEMRGRLRELEEQLDNEEALLFALEAYSDKAIKKMAVEAISEQMMATVNKMASLVFEGYSFEFVWDTQIKLLVHRGSKPPTDVRKLSGAESKLFTLILVFSLLMFVPTRKRLSLLILDEPCASFHEGMIERFHSLLPPMLTLIPSILVITPKEYERYPGAYEYTVYRDQDVAKIVKGHPSCV
jgi:DNA repair exonuclease SbcCD ATPase subunit